MIMLLVVLEMFCSTARISVDAASRGVVNERIRGAIPKSIGHVDNVGVGEVNGDVAVCVSGKVVLEVNGRSVEMNGMLIVEGGGGGAPARTGVKMVSQSGVRNGREEMLAGLFLREDFGTGSVQSVVAVGVVDVPVRVDEMFDRIGVDARKGVADGGF
jgi:hypothetical protein